MDTDSTVSLNMEDVLMFSLKHNMKHATKACLVELQNEVSNLSVLCQVQLVIAFMSPIIQKQSHVDINGSGKNLLAYSHILRDLRFIKSNINNIAPKQYASATLKLNKLIAINLLCVGASETVVKDYIQNNLLADLSSVTASSQKITRSTNLLLRDVKTFQSFINDFASDRKKALDYMHSVMKLDYNDEFWKSLCSDLNAYIHEVQLRTPIPQLHQILSRETNLSKLAPSLRSKVISCSALNEDDILLLVNELKGDFRNSRFHEDKSIKYDQENISSNSVKTASDLRQVPYANSDLFPLKELSVVLTDMKTGEFRLTDCDGPKRPKSIISSRRKLSRVLAETTPQNASVRNRSRDRSNFSNGFSPQCVRSPSQRNRTNSLKHFTFYKEEKENLGILPGSSKYRTTLISKACVKINSKLNPRSRRKLLYTAEESQIFLNSNDEISSSESDDIVWESDCSDSDSVILSLENDQLPDFTKFLAEKPSLKCNSVVVLDRL